MESRLDNTLVAFNHGSAGISCTSLVTAGCCDIYGNEGGDWVGCLQGQSGANGNISADPLFCDPAHRNYTLNVTSPCLNPECVLIGAWPVGCPVAGVPPSASAAGPRILPNPMRGSCRISLSAAGAGPVSLEIADVSGRVVRRLIGGGVSDGLWNGGPSVIWDGRDDAGRPVASGIYLARLRAGGGALQTSRIVALR